MVECNGGINPCNPQELNDVVKTLKANGNRITGKDGGRVIDILAKNLRSVDDIGSYGECGLIKVKDQPCYLFLSVYDWGDYKIVCQCQMSHNYDNETNPIYYGTVDLYNK